MRIAEGGDGDTVMLEGEAQILELGGRDEDEEDALAKSGFEAMREGDPAVAGQRSLYHDMYLQHQQQHQHKQKQQQPQQQQNEQETSDKAVSADLLPPKAAAATTITPHPTLELTTQASTESALDSEEKNVQTDWSTIGKVRWNEVCGVGLFIGCVIRNHGRS